MNEDLVLVKKLTKLLSIDAEYYGIKICRGWRKAAAKHFQDLALKFYEDKLSRGSSYLGIITNENMTWGITLHYCSRN